MNIKNNGIPTVGGWTITLSNNEAHSLKDAILVLTTGPISDGSALGDLTDLLIDSLDPNG